MQTSQSQAEGQLVFWYSAWQSVTLCCACLGEDGGLAEWPWGGRHDGGDHREGRADLLLGHLALHSTLEVNSWSQRAHLMSRALGLIGFNTSQIRGMFHEQGENKTLQMGLSLLQDAHHSQAVNSLAAQFLSAGFRVWAENASFLCSLVLFLDQYDHLSFRVDIDYEKGFGWTRAGGLTRWLCASIPPCHAQGPL